MPDKAPKPSQQAKLRAANGAPRDRVRILATRGDDGTWHLIHPRCAMARQEDLDEVRKMTAAGELEIARDELRWLLAECHDFLAAHELLGRLALTEGDVRLARGHFGYAYQLGLKAIDRARVTGPLPFSHPENQPFYEAGKGLVECLLKQNNRQLAGDVVARLTALDPTDPLQLRRLVDAHRGARRKRRKQ
jgi:hypothetical protein